MTELELKIYRVIDKSAQLGPYKTFLLLTKGRKDKSGAFIEGVRLLPSLAISLIWFLFPETYNDVMIEEYNRFLIAESKLSREDFE